MRKLTASVILATLPILSSGCSTAGKEAPIQGSTPPTISTEVEVPRTAAEQTGPDKTYFAAAPGDEGMVVESRQITRERASKDYVNEKQAVNYMIAGGKAPRGNLSYDARVGAAGGAVLDPEPGVAQPWKPADDTTKFKAAIQEPLSTFSADVDTASFSNIRRELMYGQLPSPDQVRTEEMLNYFNYDLPEPTGEHPFSVTTEVSDCPWSDQTKLMRVAIKTKSLDRGDAPPRNLVFLLDVSGSMQSPDKLPLLKQSLRQLVDTLDDNDQVAIVVYAGGSGVVLPSTSGDKKLAILDAIEDLQAGGSTNGAGGIQLAYQVAEAGRTENSVNRVVLATDGDFNVGISSQSELKSFIEEKRKSGLFLSVLGFGRGGNDKTMETLADNGNGNYASIDNLNEARKVLVQEAGATLVTVAKDVKFQVAFDPDQVESYRLVGYKNRRLANRDFDDDTKDAGELGAGHEVTALYEIRLKNANLEKSLLQRAGLGSQSDLATIKLRYKAPDADKSKLMERPVKAKIAALDDASGDQQWSAAVAGFGMLLEGDLSGKEMPFPTLYKLMKPAMSSDPDAYQSEFYSLVKKGESLMSQGRE